MSITGGSNVKKAKAKKVVILRGVLTRCSSQAVKQVGR